MTAIPGDVTDPAHRDAIAAALAPAGQLDLLMNQREPARAQSPADAAQLPAGRARGCLPGQRPGATGPDPAAGRPAHGGRRHNRERQLGRGRRRLPRLGRLRLGQGRARPGHGGPRHGGAGAALLRVRPGRHAHRHATARVPGRGHLRAAAGAGGSCGRLCCGCSASGRPAAVTGPATTRRQAPLRPASRTRPASRARRWPGDPLGQPSPRSPRAGPGRRPAAGRHPGRPGPRPLSGTCPASWPPATSWSSTNSATLAAALPGRRTGGAAVTVHLSGQLDDGAWLVELRQGSPAPARLSDGVSGEIITLPGGGSVTLLHAYPDPAATRMWAAAVMTGAATVHDYLGPARPAGPLLLRPGPVAADGLPDRLRPLPLAARRCRARAGHSPLTWSPG